MCTAHVLYRAFLYWVVAWGSTPRRPALRGLRFGWSFGSWQFGGRLLWLWIPPSASGRSVVVRPLLRRCWRVALVFGHFSAAGWRCCPALRFSVARACSLDCVAPAATSPKPLYKPSSTTTNAGISVPPRLSPRAQVFNLLPPGMGPMDCALTAAESHDDGETWSAPVVAAKPRNPGSLDILKLRALVS